MFPENMMFDFILLHLEEEITGYIPPVPEQMSCDRWLARSALQKAIRRGEVEIAQRALGTLLDQDRYGVWRHLIVIALEDVGVAGMDLVERVVAAGRNRTWRKKMGGEWAVASFLVRKMAESNHCQAACDLLLRAKNCSSLEQARADAIDADPADLIQQLGGLNASLEARGVAALALIGELADDLRPANAAA
ncbi:MAG: hypothetical protein KKF15_07905 [Alphaproteobacteria bacterium]|nr:hypothetical protein [Alphaproteobacteria bacterium]